MIGLSPEHDKLLSRGSAISDEVIKARGYRSVPQERVSELAALGFILGHRRPGLLIPVHFTDGGNGLFQLRFDNEFCWDDKKKPKNPDGTYPQKKLRYATPKAAALRVDCPPKCRPMLGDPDIPLWLTEGVKKSDSLASQGACAIALLGVWNFKGKNDVGGVTFLADFDHVALKGREVNIAFDSDVMQKPSVRKALERLTEHLQRKDATVGRVYLPPDENRKIGVDDYFASGKTLTDLQGLIEAPRPEPLPAAPKLVMKAHRAPTMDKPLALFNGVAYAATHIPFEVTRTEGRDKRGNVVKFDPPKVVEEERLCIVSSTGKLHVDDNPAPLDDLPFRIALDEPMQDSQQWSPQGVTDYCAKKSRPDGARLFDDLVLCVHEFLDFDRSFGTQAEMCSYVACWALSTWFMPGLTVASYIWPTGPYGTGKTNLLIVLSKICYLAELILPSGTHAAIRTFAQYGSTLLIDDAERLTYRSNTDNPLRELLLGGNRKGATVPMRVPSGERGWRNVRVNSFSPKGFSAVNLPDSVLASRAVMVPLKRTTDRNRGNTDPNDTEYWPIKLRKLTDDLWALALANLADIPQFERHTRERARLSGRPLQAWLQPLTIAKWLEDKCGVSGLFAQIDHLSVKYQAEANALQHADFTALIIQALFRRTVSTIRTNTTVTYEKSIKVPTRKIADAAAYICEMGDSDIDPDRITSRRVGKAMRGLRLRKAPREERGEARAWLVSPDDLREMSVTYSIPLPDELVSLE